MKNEGLMQQAALNHEKSPGIQDAFIQCMKESKAALADSRAARAKRMKPN
jgi:hypothetical protein